MATQPVRIGVVGAGFFGQVAHLRNYSQLPSCQIVAIAELRPDLLHKVADRFSIPGRFPSHHEMLAAGGIDAVIVVTARAAMGPIVLDCLEAGKHVLSEKPIAGSSELAAQLITVARRNRRIFWVGYMKRHDQGVTAAKALVDRLLETRELGDLIFARAHCFGGDAYYGEQDYERSSIPMPSPLTNWPLSPTWIAEQDRRSFDRYLNTFCHDLNLIRYMIGPPRVTNAPLIDGQGAVSLQCKQIPVVFETAFVEHADWEEGMQLVFQKGWVTVKLPAPLHQNMPATVQIYRGKAAPERLELPPSWAFRRQAEKFIDAVQANDANLAFAEEAQLDVQLTEEIWRTNTNR